MNYDEFKQCVIAAAAKAGLADYELYYQTGESLSASAVNREIKEFSSSLEGGVCFRCLVDGRMGYASTELLSVGEAVAIVRRARDNALVLESEETEYLSEGGKTYQPVPDRDEPLPGAETLTALALAGQEALYAADAAVIDGSESEVIAARDTVAIYNSRGLDLHAAASSALCYLSAVLNADGEMNDAYDFKRCRLSELDLKAMAAKAAGDARAMLGAEPAPTGSYPVVFSPKAMASLLAVYSAAFSAEAAARGLSRLKGREGEIIAAGTVTLSDDPFDEHSAMPRAFDAEGSPTYAKHVIEQGRLTTLLHNLKTAHAAGVETTGNAAKSGYDARVEIRPFTFRLEPGALTEEELLAKAGEGVFITELGGLHAGANPVSGDFSLQSSGFMIEGGKKTRPVKSFTVAGNFFELLQHAEALSDRVEYPGMGGFASPAVLVTGLSIAGK